MRPCFNAAAVSIPSISVCRDFTSHHVPSQSYALFAYSSQPEFSPWILFSLPGLQGDAVLSPAVAFPAGAVSYRARRAHFIWLPGNTRTGRCPPLCLQVNLFPATTPFGLAAWDTTRPVYEQGTVAIHHAPRQQCAAAADGLGVAHIFPTGADLLYCCFSLKWLLAQASLLSDLLHSKLWTCLFLSLLLNHIKPRSL